MKKYFSYFLIIALLLSFSFANNTSSAQIPDPDPVIIVPGITGSWNWDVMLDRDTVDDDWDFFALDKTFDNLIQALEDDGFVRGENLFVAFYDWRKGNADSANDYLIPVIDQALVTSASGKVDIVAHSMGGLVARSYIQGDSYRDDIDQFVMLGTPNHGSSDVYTLWEGGEVPDNWEKTQQYIIDLYLWYMTIATSQTEDFYDTIHQHIPSIGELLPTYDYLDDGGLKPFDQMIEQNALLNDLNSDEKIFDLADRVLGLSIIAGEGESTVNEIPVTDRDVGETKLWVDGVPSPNPPVTNDTEGDNRVLLESVFLPELMDEDPVPTLSRDGKEDKNNKKEKSTLLAFVKKFIPEVRAQDFGFEPVVDERTLASTHGGLPTTGIDDLFDILALNTPSTEFVPPIEPDNILTFWFASPVEVAITDPDGNTITKDGSEISGAAYDGENDPAGVKIVIIPEPKEGDYDVKLLGIGNGGYHMAASSFSNSGDFINTVEGTIEEGQVLGYTVTYQSGIANPTEISEPFELEEKDPEDMIEELIEDVEESYEVGLIKKKSTKKHLIKNLDKALKKLEKDKKWQAISHLGRFNLKLKYYERRNKIDSQTASDLRGKAEEIIDILKSDKKDFGNYYHRHDDDEDEKEDDD